MRELIFVDTETTGLSPEGSHLVELAYAQMEGPVNTLYFGVTEVPEFIDELIGFTKRGLSGMRSVSGEINEFLTVTDGATMVAANPAFDKGFLDKNQLFKFHYRMLDIESYAAGKFGSEFVPSMKNIYDELEADGWLLSEPDHTAAGDVTCMREAYKILRDDY